MDLFVVHQGYDYATFTKREDAFAFVEGTADWSIMHYILKPLSPEMVLWALNTEPHLIGQLAGDFKFIEASAYIADSDGYLYGGDNTMNKHSEPHV